MNAKSLEGYWILNGSIPEEGPFSSLTDAKAQRHFLGAPRVVKYGVASFTDGGRNGSFQPMTPIDAQVRASRPPEPSAAKKIYDLMGDAIFETGHKDQPVTSHTCMFLEELIGECNLDAIENVLQAWTSHNDLRNNLRIKLIETFDTLTDKN